MIEKIKKLRIETGVGIRECQLALQVSNGNFEEAKKLLFKLNAFSGTGRQEKETNEGIVVSYIHSNSKLGSFLEIRCETDFVAKNEIFTQLANNIAIHISATNPDSIGTLLSESFIKDEEFTINDLIQQAIVKLGENIVIKQFSRFSI